MVDAGGSQPTIGFAPVQPQDITISPDALRFWVYGPEGWSFQLESSGATVLYRTSDEWTEVGTLSGTSHADQGEWFEVELAIQPEWLAPGNYHQPLYIRREQGQLLTAYTHGEQLSVLASSSGFVVDLGNGGSEKLREDCWTVFDLDAALTILWGDLVIYSQGDPKATGTLQSAVTDGVLWWEDLSFAIAIGEQVDLRLQIDHSSDDDLILHCSPSLAILGVTVDGADVTWRERDNRVIVPRLGDSRSQIVVITVQGRLAPTSLGWIEADVAGRIARMEGAVERGWFGSDAQITVRTIANGRPAPYQRLLLPNGDVVFTDSDGEVELHLAPGVHRLICLDSDRDPVFLSVDVPVHRAVDVDVGEEVSPGRPYLVWDLALYPRFSAEVTAHTPSGSMRFSNESAAGFRLRQGSLQGQFRGAPDRSWEISWQAPPDGGRFVWGEWDWMYQNTRWQGRFADQSFDATVSLTDWRHGDDLRLVVRRGAFLVDMAPKRVGAVVNSGDHRFGLSWDDGMSRLWWRQIDPNGYWQFSIADATYNIRHRRVSPWGSWDSEFESDGGRWELASALEISPVRGRLRLEGNPSSLMWFLAAEHAGLVWGRGDLALSANGLFGLGEPMVEVLAHGEYALTPAVETGIHLGYQFSGAHSHLLYGWRLSVQQGHFYTRVGWSRSTGTKLDLAFSLPLFAPIEP